MSYYSEIVAGVSGLRSSLQTKKIMQVYAWEYTDLIIWLNLTWNFRRLFLHPADFSKDLP